MIFCFKGSMVILVVEKGVGEIEGKSEGEGAVVEKLVGLLVSVG